jgi:tetratricopeptide (TPR) repeat protein
MIVGFSGLSSLEIDRESNTEYETVQSNLRQKAEDYERKVQPLEAAALWMELGEIDRAAQQYEAAKSWLDAAIAWEKLANYDRRAGAFEQRALVLSNQDVDKEEITLAWQQAARAYQATTHKEARLRCEREVARWRKQPLLAINANPGEMTLHRWMELEYRVINNGFGLASGVTISLKGERFEGESQQTLSSPTLGPGSEYTRTIRVRPTEQGNSVPLEFVIEFVDHLGKHHRYDSTIVVHVISDMPAESQAQSAVTITQLSASSLAELARLPAGGHDLPGLYNKMIQYFSQTDLDLIIIDLGLARADFSPKLSLMTKELITAIARKGRLDELIEVCSSRRPNVVW